MVAARMHRGQYLLRPEHVAKVRAIADAEHISVSEVIRRSVSAYDPGARPQAGTEDDEALALAIRMLRETSAEVRRTRERLAEGAARMLDPQVESELRARVREAIAQDPELVAGVRRLLASQAQEAP